MTLHSYLANSSFARINLPTTVDIDALQREILQLSEDQWIPHVNINGYSGQWDVLPLRCLQEHEFSHPILKSFAIEVGEQWCDLPILTQLSNVKNILAAIRCETQSVRLMRLHASAYIKPHRDAGLAIEYGAARLHMPIITDESVEFCVNEHLVKMRAGELVYINADQTHWVRNNSKNPRVHLVVDCKVNAWLLESIVCG